MTDVNQVRKAVLPLKIIFWVHVVRLALLVFYNLLSGILVWPPRAGESVQITVFYLTAQRTIEAACILLILIVSWRLAATFKRQTRVWPLYLVAVIEACVSVVFLCALLLSTSIRLAERYSGPLFTWQITAGIVHLAVMFLISLFTAWLCAQVFLSDSTGRWKRAAGAFFFIYMLPNAIYRLPLLLPLLEPVGRIPIIYDWPFIIGITVLTHYPLLLFYNSIKEMVLDVQLAASGDTQGDVVSEESPNA